MFPFDPNRQQMYQQYAQAAQTGDYSGINPQEAQGNIQQFVQNAPPDQVQSVFAQHFANIPADQRAQIAREFPPEYGINPNDPNSLAQGVARAQQERPDVLQRIVSHPILVAGAAGLAAIMAKHMLDQQGR
jgi:hypothetical protein